MQITVNEKKYFLMVLGCQMNKSDSERIERVLDLMGYSKACAEEDANIIGVVSCSVRQKAMDRMTGKLQDWNDMKKTRPVITLLTGCVLPHDRINIGKKFDILLDLNDLRKLPQMVSAFEGFDVQSDTRFEMEEYDDYFSFQPKYHESYKAYIPIMTGCDKFCTYCAVPFTRGRERSRTISDVLSEVRTLVEKGCLEVTLLGQNVNSYHPSNIESAKSPGNPYQDAFAVLLWELNQLDSLNRIHFTAPHPRDMSDDVVSALSLPKHVNFLHLPMQSGDDEVLRKMNRKYTASDFLKLIEKIREKNPTIALATDIIVGFCGETPEQFQRTLDIYEKIAFDISYNAMYSPRIGTVSEKLWDDDVSREEKKQRWDTLQNLMETITLKKNQEYKNAVCEVLVDSYSKGFCIGNNREYKLVRFASDVDLTGKIVLVKITDPKTWILEGEPIFSNYETQNAQIREKSLDTV